LTGGNVHDANEAEALIEAAPEGATLLGDKGYDSTAIREAATARNIWANIPNRSNRKQHFGFSPWLYLSCPLSGGPSSMMGITRKGTSHAVEEAQARGDHREAA